MISIRNQPAMSPISRREMLSQSLPGFGALALASLLFPNEAPAQAPRQGIPLAAKSPHFSAKAKSVIFLYMTGGPSQVDTFDPKPDLQRLNGQPIPASFQTDNLKLQFMKATDGKLMGSPFAFTRQGESGWRFRACFRSWHSTRTNWLSYGRSITIRSFTDRRSTRCVPDRRRSAIPVSDRG